MRAVAAAGGAAAPCLLGVERSLGGKRWLSRGGDDRAALALAQALSLPELVGRVLAGRGVTPDTAGHFLDPTLRSQLPDPDHLRDMAEAVDRLVTAVMQGERIAVFGDYDVDGATSSALLERYLRAVGGACRVYIPDRLSEGYGPNAPALLRLRDEGVSVVVTVDCGTGAVEALARARDVGLDVVVVDHHEAESHLPAAVAVVNPNRLDESSPHGSLAAVGVVFLLVVGLNRALRRAGWFRDRPEPSPLQWLDLVALGTVCDVVPLVGVNRALVAQGLKVMARRANVGLAALADVAGVAEPPGAYHAGFLLGPRLNAGGRVGESSLGARLLATDDPDEARALAARLDALNRERQAIEARVLDEALAQVGDAPGSLAFAAGEGWHPGVVGIVASRLKERFGVPACVIGLDGAAAAGTGSGRSVPGVDLGASVIAARQAGLLVKGGGHAMAAGFTVERDRLEALRTFLTDRTAAAIAEADVRPTVRLDGVLQVGAASLELAESLDRVGPFGAGNPEPRFALADARIAHARVVGDSHVKCALAAADGRRLEAIAFRAVGSELGTALLGAAGGTLHLAGRLRVNTWRGMRAVQFQIDDAARPW